MKIGGIIILLEHETIFNFKYFIKETKNVIR